MSTTTRLSLREACGSISHDEASEMLTRFIASHFNGRMGSSGEHARITIPADPRRDDDLRLSAYIEQQRASTASLERELAELRMVAKAKDRMHARLAALINRWTVLAGGSTRAARDALKLCASQLQQAADASAPVNAKECLPAASEPAKEPSDHGFAVGDFVRVTGDASEIRSWLADESHEVCQEPPADRVWIRGPRGPVPVHPRDLVLVRKAKEPSDE